MKYWISRFAITDWGRYSIMFENTEVKSLLDDNKYNEDLKVDWFTTQYFVQLPDNLEISGEEANKFDLQLLSTEEAINWIKSNTNLEEVENWRFLLYPRIDTPWMERDAQYLEII